jgi:hypothetical protein
MKEPLTKRLAIIHFVLGLIVIIFWTFVFIYPGLIAYLLKAVLFEMPSANGIFEAIDWALTGIANILLFVAFIWLIIAAPFVAAFSILLCGIPSMVGSIAIFKDKLWGTKVLRLCSFSYLVIFPLGTILGIYTLITLKKLK